MLQVFPSEASWTEYSRQKAEYEEGQRRIALFRKLNEDALAHGLIIGLRKTALVEFRREMCRQTGQEFFDLPEPEGDAELRFWQALMNASENAMRKAGVGFE